MGRKKLEKILRIIRQHPDDYFFIMLGNSHVDVESDWKVHNDRIIQALKDYRRMAFIEHDIPKSQTTWNFKSLAASKEENYHAYIYRKGWCKVNNVDESIIFALAE